MIPKAILSFFLVPTACTLPHLPMSNIALIVIGAVLLLLGIVITIILTMIAVLCSELCQYDTLSGQISIVPFYLTI